MLGEYGIGNISSEGLMRITPYSIPNNITEITIAALGFTAYDPYSIWIRDAVVYYNNNNNNSKIAVVFSMKSIMTFYCQRYLITVMNLSYVQTNIYRCSVLQNI